MLDKLLKNQYLPTQRSGLYPDRFHLLHSIESRSIMMAIDTLHVNGKLTLGENIGDLGGLSISFTALEHALKGKNAEPIDGFTPEQRFFLSYAQVWRRIVTPEQLRLQVKTDSHSPANFRVNGPLVNLQEFYDAFHCGQEGTMFVPPEKRAMIWNYR